MTKSEYLKMTLKEIAPELNFNLIDPLIDQITAIAVKHWFDDSQKATLVYPE